MNFGIQNTVNSGHGTALIYTAILAAALGDILPTPGDALYFYIQENLKQKQAKGLLTPAEYWKYESISYYTSNFIWWMALLGIVYASKGSFNHKLKIGAVVIGAGAVVGVIAKNIQREEDSKLF
jgi:hypothetical protein